MGLPPFPWLYPYQEDGPRLNTVVLRPVVPVSLVGSDVAPPTWALVDSGCEHVLAAPWLASTVGVEAKDSHRSLDLGIGGQTVEVRFVDLTLRLYAPNATTTSTSNGMPRSDSSTGGARRGRSSWARSGSSTGSRSP